MLKVYLDLGYKPGKSDDVMCISAVVYKNKNYKRFVRQWEPMLKAWGASNFHATDFYNGCGEFVRDTNEKLHLFDYDSKRIPNMIGKYIERVLLVSFKPKEFSSVVPEFWRKTVGESMHSQAVQLALISNGYWLEDHYPNESFAYFMESGDDDQGEVEKAVERMRSDHVNGTSRVIAVSSFTPVCKKLRVRGIEAADFAAWHWNKYYMDKVRIGDGDNPRKDFAAFIASQKIQFIFPTDDRLKYYFSRISKETLLANI